MAAEQILAEDSDSVMGGLGSKLGAKSMDVKKEDVGSATAADVAGKGGEERVEINLNGEVSVEPMSVGRCNGERVEDQDHEFRVGDFVWGKIKSHPWWPGQVYDPKDASEFALKHCQEGRALVAFFGDRSCSWCMPSLLIPFVENLERMQGESSSKSFVNAVQQALDEIGRLVELKISCRCIELEKRVHLLRPVVSNAGVKAGVLVPEVDDRSLSIPDFEPSEILARVLEYGRSASFYNLFELSVLKSQVSAFSYAKCGVELCVYSDPLVIEGLEGPDDKVDDLNAPMNGPEVDCERKKQKSVAEVMAKKNAARSRSRERRSGGEGGSSSRKRTRKVSASREKEVEDEVEAEGGCSARERKKSKYLSYPYTDLKGGLGGPSFKLEPEVDELVNTAMDSEDPDFSAFVFAENSDEEADNGKQITFSASDVNLEVHDVLLKMQSAAVDNLYLREEGHLDSIWDFISAYRNSTYVRGSDYRVLNKFKKASVKRKSMATPSRSMPRRCSSKISPLRKSASSSPSDDLVSDARVIKEKVGTMMKNLKSSGSRFSAEEISCLKDELKGLMERVEMANEKILSMAENASS